MGNRYSPTVVPTVTRDPFEAGFAGLERGFGIGTEIAERQRRRGIEDRQERRSDEYLDMQRRNTEAAAMARAIEQARAGYGEGEGDPGDENVIDVPGYGHLNYNRSEAAASHRAQEGAVRARTEEARNYAEQQQRELEDAIRRNDEAAVMSRSPDAAREMRPRAPVEGTPEWREVETFKTNEQIRADRATGRYSYRGSSGGSTNPRAREIATAIDDERARNSQYRGMVRDLRPGQVVISPSDTAGFGAAQRDLAGSDARLARLQRDYDRETGLFDDEDPEAGVDPRTQMNFSMTAERMRLQAAISRVARDPRIPPERKQAIYDELIAEWKRKDPTAGMLRRP